MSETRLNQRKVPKQRRAEATVSSVVEAAARILEVEGLDGYNTNAVARLAGISVGSLYQYFPHKEAITRALIDREATTLIAAIERIAEDGEGMTAIKEMVAAIVTHLMRMPNLARILDAQEQKLSLEEQVRKSEDRVQDLIGACLSESVYAPLAASPSIVSDVTGIIRGMVDSAVARGDRSIPHLISRINRATEGYLAFSIDLSDDRSS